MAHSKARINMSAHDWESDPRPLKDALLAWADHHGQGLHGAAPWCAARLAVNPRTMAGILQGRPCSYEATVRRLMTMIDAFGRRR